MDLFSGRESCTQRVAAPYNIVEETIGYTPIYAQIEAADPTVTCNRVSPFDLCRATTMKAICKHVKALCKQEWQRYIYAYHFQPDMDMHDTGCYSKRVKAKLLQFGRQIQRLAGRLKDTLLIVTAGHGLCDITELLIEDFPEIEECLRTGPTREPRSLSFFVKPEYMDAFPARWNRRFGESYRLMTAEEALASGLFGSGTPHPRTRGFLGDYVTLATGEQMLWNRNEKGEVHGFKAAYAGLLEQEMLVPLILIER